MQKNTEQGEVLFQLLPVLEEKHFLGRHLGTGHGWLVHTGQGQE